MSSLDQHNNRSLWVLRTYCSVVCRQALAT